jgi:cytochrome c-type biogenesis protein CcmH/NrfG
MREFRKLRSGQMEFRRVEKDRYDDFGTMCRRVATTYTAAARLYHAHGKQPEAEALLQRAVALAPQELEPQQALAWICRQQGRTREAIQRLEGLAKLEPKNPAYWLEIGRLRVAREELDAAEEAFRNASRIAPESADAYAELAGLHLTRDRKLPEALALARMAVQKRPSAANHALLSAASQRNGDHAGAVAAMAKAAELEPGNPEYRAKHDLLKRSP